MSDDPFSNPYLRDKTCLLCKREFAPSAPSQKICDDCSLPYPTDSPEYTRWWRQTFPEKAKEGKQSWWNSLSDEKKRYYKERGNERRKERRRRIQETWGFLGGKGEKFYRPTEDYAIKVLKREGYEGVKNLNYFKQNLFDVKGIKNSQIYVFQVTTRTHVDDAKRHRQLAGDLGLVYKILFVKPDLSGYILTEKTSIAEYMLKEVKSI